MTREEALAILINERECVRSRCEHNCGTCHLAREESEILAALTMAIHEIDVGGYQQGYADGKKKLAEAIQGDLNGMKRELEEMRRDADEKRDAILRARDELREIIQRGPKGYYKTERKKEREARRSARRERRKR